MIIVFIECIFQGEILSQIRELIYHSDEVMKHVSVL